MWGFKSLWGLILFSIIECRRIRRCAYSIEACLEGFLKFWRNGIWAILDYVGSWLSILAVLFRVSQSYPDPQLVWLPATFVLCHASNLLSRAWDERGVETRRDEEKEGLTDLIAVQWEDPENDERNTKFVSKLPVCFEGCFDLQSSIFSLLSWRMLKVFSSSTVFLLGAPILELARHRWTLSFAPHLLQAPICPSPKLGRISE